MVRTPLARRVPGNDLLNSVECVLPHFDKKTAARVAKTMLGDREHDDDGTGGGAGRRVLLAPVDMEINQAIPEPMLEVFDNLPSQTLPRKIARPVRRLPALAQALSRDRLRVDARKDAYQKLFAKLDGLLAQHKKKVEAASKGNRGHWTVEAVHHILDNAWDEDRSRIRTGHGPENTSRLRRFAIGVIHAHSRNGVAAAQRQLHRNPRLVFDYLKMTKNTLGPPPLNPKPDRRTN